jgi:hypothetical protein
MKNDDLMTKIRSADPVRPTSFVDWTESPAGRRLAERILATDPRGGEPDVDRTRRRFFSGTRLVAGATAAVLILGVIGVVSLRDSDTGTAWAAPLVRIAEDSPRLLIAEAGWEVVRADEFSGEYGEMTFSNGPSEMDLNWIPVQSHKVAVKDRRVGSQESWNLTIADGDAVLFQYEDTTYFTALWRDGDHSLELSGAFPNMAEYRAVAETLQTVDVNTWLSAMPESVVKPDARAASVEEMLADIPVHPRVDVDRLKASERVTERYQLGAKVTGAVACAWIGQWVEATSEGDERRARKAVDAMATSHNWAILNEMNEAGDWPEVLWELADAMPDDATVSGGRPMTIAESYESALGCERFR